MDHRTSFSAENLVKICGLSTPETLEAAIGAGADMVGFVFFAQSPRNLTLGNAEGLARLVRKRAAKAVLTVDADDGLLDQIALSVRPDVLQLHGRETPERIAAIKERYGLPILKAVGVSTRADLAAIGAYGSALDRSDMILLDAKPPKGAAHPGGNGHAFDWAIIEDLDPSVRFMLSGGLDPANVAEAIRLVRPRGVDVSSGVEDAPGVKSIAKIEAFIAAARAAFAGLETFAEDRAL